MEEPKRVFVSIYCEVYKDRFSPEMFNRMATCPSSAKSGQMEVKSSLHF